MAKGKAKWRLGDKELMDNAATLAESAEKDGAVSRVFFAGRTSRAGIIPFTDLLVMVVKPGQRRRVYTRFTNEWPRDFKAVGCITRLPRFLCSVPAGMLDGIMYLGTEEVRWTPLRQGETRKPVRPGTDGCGPGCTSHDLHERDLRRARALNPIRLVWHRTLLMLGRLAYGLKACAQEGEEEVKNEEELEEEKEKLDVSDHLQLPDFLTSINLPFQKFKVRHDASDALGRAARAIQAFSEGRNVVEESGASLFLRVLRHASEGVWLSDACGVERAPYTGMFRLNNTGEIVGQAEAPVGYDGDTEDVGGIECLPALQTDTFPDPSEAVNTELDRFFEVGSRQARFCPTVTKEWRSIRQNQPLWLPEGTPKKVWDLDEMSKHPRYETLCLLAALATVEERGKLAYADLDLVAGSATWVNLDSVPRVQLVSGLAGLCHYSNGIRCNLAHLDIEAHLRETRATSLANKAH